MEIKVDGISWQLICMLYFSHFLKPFAFLLLLPHDHIHLWKIQTMNVIKLVVTLVMSFLVDIFWYLESLPPKNTFNLKLYAASSKEGKDNRVWVVCAGVWYCMGAYMFWHSQVVVHFVLSGKMLSLEHCTLSHSEDWEGAQSLRPHPQLSPKLVLELRKTDMTERTVYFRKHTPNQINIINVRSELLSETSSNHFKPIWSWKSRFIVI